ncbi:MAG: N-acetyltransferase family protein [Armatimonadetes bacterium]|nr:N-acetyltransferase family protein [Armatimonadota bacterium]
MLPADWPAVRAIYADGIATGHATFQTEAHEWEAWDAGHLATPCLVARVAEAVAGWAALSSVSSRCVYGGVAEVSLYVGAAWRGRGVGSGLLAALIEASEQAGLWTLQAGIFPENGASLALFGKHGFRVVGVRERLGQMTFGPLAGSWRDVVLLERRSA